MLRAVPLGRRSSFYHGFTMAGPSRSIFFLAIAASFILLISLLPFVSRFSYHSATSNDFVKRTVLEDRSLELFNTRIRAADDDYTCSADKPCGNGACWYVYINITAAFP